MLKQGNGLRFVAHFGQAQCVVVEDCGIVRIDRVKLLEEVEGARKLALAGEGDGLFVGWGHVAIFSQPTNRSSGSVMAIEGDYMIGRQPTKHRHRTRTCAGCNYGCVGALQSVEHGGIVTEKLVPYWVGNVAHVHFPAKGFRMTPDPIATAYVQIVVRPASAKVIALTRRTKR